MLDTLSTHTNSYCKIQVSGSQLRFYDDPDFPAEGLCTWDPDCTGNGYYSYTVDGSGLKCLYLVLRLWCFRWLRGHCPMYMQQRL